jgi:hypothetical protein
MISLVLLVLLLINQHTCLICKLSAKHVAPNKTNHKQCDKHKCGAIDDVNNPAYNMQNIVKQSILLEEHLAEKNKYCKGCLVKHFNHIIALSSEGVWLAEKNLNKYPFLEESPSFYQKIFDKWLANQDDNTTRLEVLSLLRERRRQLIDVYFLSK